MAAPQALTPEQIQQIIAAGRGNTVNIGGTLYGGQWADIGDGESRQEGALQSIYGSTGIDQAGQPFYSYDPSGAYTGQGVTKESKSFFGGLADAFRDPVVLAALGGASYAGLLGGGGAAIGNGAFLGEGIPTGVGAWDAAFTGAGGSFNPAFALGADVTTNTARELAAANSAANTALTNTAATTASTGLTAAQIANLARAGINVAGLIGVTNAVTNMGGGGNNTSTPITYSGGGAGGYSPEYFSQLQSNYNSLMPNVPRDVASPLQNWYSTEFNPGASVTGSLFGGMTGGMAPNTGVKPVTPPVVKPPVVPPVVKPPITTVTPAYANLTKTSTPVDVAKAYTDFIASAGGNTAANRQAATDYLTNLGLTQGQIESSYNAYLDTLPAAGNTYQQLNAKATPSNVVQAYTAFVANAGGDTATNRQLAADYLKDIGVSDALINQAYNTYLASTTNAAGGGGGGGNVDVGAGGGMLSGGGGASTTGTVAAAEPSYTTLGASSSPQSIAAAYADFVANSGGDTAANQQAAVEYLTNLGIGQDTIGSAYGLFKGA